MKSSEIGGKVWNWRFVEKWSTFWHFNTQKKWTVTVITVLDFFLFFIFGFISMNFCACLPFFSRILICAHSFYCSNQLIMYSFCLSCVCLIWRLLLCISRSGTFLFCLLFFSLSLRTFWFFLLFVLLSIWASVSPAIVTIVSFSFTWKCAFSLSLPLLTYIHSFI